MSIQMFANEPKQIIYNQLHKIHDLQNLLHDLRPTYINQSAFTFLLLLLREQ